MCLHVCARLKGVEVDMSGRGNDKAIFIFLFPTPVHTVDETRRKKDGFIVWNARTICTGFTSQVKYTPKLLVK